MKQDLFGVPLFWNAIVFETNGGGGGGSSSSSDDDDGPQLSASAQSQVGEVKQDERGNWYAVKQIEGTNALGRDYSIDPKDNRQGPTFGKNVSKDIEEMFPDEVAAAGGSSEFQGSIRDTFKDTDVAAAGFDPATNTYNYNPITPDVDPLSLDLPMGGPGTFQVGSLPAAPNPIDYTMSFGEAGRGGPDSAAPTQGITSLSPVVNLDTMGFGTSDLTSDRGYDFGFDPRGDQIVSPTGTGIGLTTDLGQNNDRLRQADDIISTTTGMVGVDDLGNFIEYGMGDDSTPTGGEYPKFDMTDNDLLKNADGTLFSGTYGGVEYTRGVPSEEIVMSQDVVAPMSFDDLYKTVIFPTRDSDEKNFGTINADAFASGVARGILSPTTYDGRTIGVPYPANIRLVKGGDGRVTLVDAATGNNIASFSPFSAQVRLADGTLSDVGGEGSGFPSADDVFLYKAAYDAGVPIFDPETGFLSDQFNNFEKQLEDSGFNYSNEMIKANKIFQPGEGVEAVMDADAIAAAMGGNTFTQGGEGQLGTGFAQAPLYDYITVDSYSEDEYNAIREAELEKLRNQIELPAIDEIATGGGGGGASPDIGSGGTNLIETVFSGGGGGGQINNPNQGGSIQMAEGLQNNPNQNLGTIDQASGLGVVMGDPTVTSQIGPGAAMPGSGDTGRELGLASLDTTGQGETGEGDAATTLTTTGTGDLTGDGSGETDDIGLDGENLGGTGDDIGVTGDGGVGLTGVDTVTTGGTGGTGDGDTGGEGTGDEEGDGGTDGEGEGTGDGEGDGDGSGTGEGTGDGTGGGDGTGDGPGTGPGDDDDDDEIVIDDEDDDDDEDEAPFECPEGYVAKKVGGKWVCRVEQEQEDFDGVRPLIRPRYEDVQIASTYTPIKLGT